MDTVKDIRSGLKNAFSTERIISKTKGDKVIWTMVVLLTLISLLAVYSATGSLAYKNYQGNTEMYLLKQIIFIIIGFIAIYLAHLANYIKYAKFAKLAFLISIPLLIYTLIAGVSVNEGSRWIRIPVINQTFQTSDLARLSLFMYLAHLISKKQAVIKDFRKGFLPIIIPVAIICLLIAPANLSTALLLGASCLMLMFIGRVSTKHLLLTIGAALLPLLFLVIAAKIRHDKAPVADNVEVPVKKSSTLFGRVDTWIGRVESFLYGSKNAADDDSYQVDQAKIAISKGGFFGVGPGNSTTRDYLPQAYNDFIYAIIIEEYGIMGGAFILLIYLAFLYRCIRIYKKCPYAFGAFLALGLSFTLAIQAVANMAVTVNLFPVTGVTLPLISMGGTSFIFTCLAIGIILSVARNVEEQEGKAGTNEVAEA